MSFLFCNFDFDFAQHSLIRCRETVKQSTYIRISCTSFYTKLISRAMRKDLLVLVRSFA